MFSIKRIFIRLGLAGKDKNILIRMINEKIDKALDIGCGDGFFLETLIKLGIVKEGYGIDIGDTYKGDSIRFYKGNAEKLPFPNNFFDAVFCIHVLEHLQNPKKCVEEIRRVLKPNKRAYVIIPKELFRGSSAIGDSLLMLITKRKLVSPRKIHLNKFDKKSLSKLFEKWKDIKIEEVKRDLLGGKSYLVIASK